MLPGEPSTFNYIFYPYFSSNSFHLAHKHYLKRGWGRARAGKGFQGLTLLWSHYLSKMQTGACHPLPKTSGGADLPWDQLLGDSSVSPLATPPGHAYLAPPLPRSELEGLEARGPQHHKMSTNVCVMGKWGDRYSINMANLLSVEKRFVTYICYPE